MANIKLNYRLLYVIRLADSKINVVGHIVEDEMILLDAMCPFQKFQLKEEIKK